MRSARRAAPAGPPRATRRVRRAAISFAVLLGALSAVSLEAAFADDTDPFRRSLPAEAFEPGKEAGYLTLAVENDMFADGHDRYYTSGVRVTWMQLSTDTSGLSRLVLNAFGADPTAAPSASYVSFGQNLYTPDDITRERPDPSDRPYAAWLYASHGTTWVTDEHVDTVELTLGLVGPDARGEAVQEFVHGIVGADEPRGWDHQLDNEPGLNVAWERRWPERIDGELGSSRWRLMPHAGIALGNIYTYGAAGATLQWFPAGQPWQAPPQRVRPALPGSGFFYAEDSGLQWSAFLGVELRAMARNIFLDGNTFESSPSVDKQDLVLDAAGGLAMSFERLRVAYTLNWRSREFHGQDDPTLFGAITVGRRF